MLTSNAITGFRNYVKRTIGKAKYRAAGNFYDATITEIRTDTDGKVSIDLILNPPISGTATVTLVQLYDTSGELWLETSTNITRKSDQNGIFYRFTINIYES